MIWQEENLQNIAQADIVIGIPSWQEADFIAAPAEQAAVALNLHFNEYKSVIINCDNNSPDNTKAAFLAAPSHGIPKIYLSTEPGIRGKGHNLRNLFQKSLELKARAVAVLDADLKGLTPLWIKNLLTPIVSRKYAYVSPLYPHYRYDGLITSNLVYPLLRAVLGRRVRQPMNGECAFSHDMAQLFVAAPEWNSGAEGFGIDLWMTSLAIRHNQPICQSYMGSPRLHRASTSISRRPLLFGMVMATFFDLMVDWQDFWPKIHNSRPTGSYAQDQGELEIASSPQLDSEADRENFQQAARSHHDMWQTFLNQDDLLLLEELIAQKHVNLPFEAWSRIVYDHAAAYGRQLYPKFEILDSLLSIWYWQELNFFQQTHKASATQLEQLIEHNCVIFEKSKPYLLERWSQ